MSAYIHHIATLTPEFEYSQSQVRDILKAWAGDPKTSRLIHAVYNRSGIDTRYSVLADFMPNAEAALYRSSPEGGFVSPQTAERNSVYTTHARRLAVDLARRAIADAPGFEAADITHVIYTSCTGFANPGPDYHVVRELGLQSNVQRYTLGFMGCYAGLAALRMAGQICDGNPNAVVLVICLELCTLHMQITDVPDSVVANSLFADGAAAAIVSGCLPMENQPALRLNGFESALVPSSESEMAWEVGNNGFNIVLSSYVPDIIGGNIHRLLNDMLQRHHTSIACVDEWAVHPGGRSILDKVEENLDLPAEALAASRAILREYGNMSSATILFVLKRVLQSAKTDRAEVCAIAFGPGLTVEAAVMERIGHYAAPAADVVVTQTLMEAAMI